MKVQENVPLAPYTTLGVGGPARWLVETGDENEMLSAVRLARSLGVPHFILGGGSNLLVADEGFPGVVIRVAGAGSVWVDEGNGFAGIVSSAGTDWDAVVQLAVEKNCAGIECLAGIPGTVGASPVQNIGAYGQEVAQTISAVRALDLQAGNAVQLSAAECGFGYRRSLFNSAARERYLITRVAFALRLDGRPHLEYRDLKHHFAERAAVAPTLAHTAAAVREIRARKGMLLAGDGPGLRSAGSFFKNPLVPAETVEQLALFAHCRIDEVPQYPAGSGSPESGRAVKLSAAWLMELAGFRKGFTMGRAALSSRHVLAIVNLGGATAAEILALRNAVTKEVHDLFSIRLEQEPVMLGSSRAPVP